MQYDLNDIKLSIEDYLESSKKSGMIQEFAQSITPMLNQLSCSDEDKKVILGLLVQASSLSVNMAANIVFNILNRAN